MSDTIDNEKEYFRQRDQEKLAKLKEQQEAVAKLEAAADLKALHYFRCGKCGNEMKTMIFRGVEIEVCDSCGAVLLDSGELEQLTGGDAGFGAALKNFLGWSSDKS